MERISPLSKENVTPVSHVGLTGASGRLGSRLVNIWHGEYDIIASRHINYISPSENLKETFEGCDITDKKAVDRYVATLQSNGVMTLINCAGLVSVDASESERGNINSPMYRVHVTGARNVVQACKKYGLKFLQLSTEYVFDGKKDFGQKYSEDDMPDFDIHTAPTFYGLTKVLGEKNISNIYPEGSAIIRVSQVQSSVGGLFLATLRALRQEKPFTRVSNQLVSAITDVTLAKGIQLVEKALHEGTSAPIYHISSTDAHTAYDTCMMLAEEYGLRNEILGLMSQTTLEDLVARGEQKVIRPKNSVLSVERFQKDFGTSILGSVKDEIVRFKQMYPNL